MPSLRPRAVIEYTDPIIDEHLGSDDDSATAYPAKIASDASYLKKVIAYVPIECIGLYQAAVNSVGATDSLFKPVVVGIWIITPIWMLYSTHRKGQTLAWDQAVTSVPAFLFWLAGLQSPFVKDFVAAHQFDWKDGYGTFAIIVGSMILPAIGDAVLWIADQTRRLTRRATPGRRMI